MTDNEADYADNYRKANPAPTIAEIVAKHTPVVWQVAEYETFLAVKNGSQTICRLSEKDKGHAHLLAAAPDLLEACKAMLEWAEYTIPNLKCKCPHCAFPIDVSGLNWGGPVGKARAALTKAQPCLTERLK